MNKYKQVGWVILIVGFVYAILAISIKFIADTSVAVNADIAAAHNMAQYPGTSGALLASPWILYFIPAVLGIAVIVLIIKRGKQV